MSEVPRLYLQIGEAVYRFKVFADAVGIERQRPFGPNCLLPKNYSPHTPMLYSDTTAVWHWEAIMALVEGYPYPDYYEEDAALD